MLFLRIRSDRCYLDVWKRIHVILEVSNSFHPSKIPSCAYLLLQKGYAVAATVLCW